MSKIIELPCSGGYHFGKMHHIKPFIGHHFEESKSDSDIIHKALIINIEYKPDSIYLTTDGYSGNCWQAFISDSREIDTNIFYFRNFRDLVHYYEKDGFHFI